MADNSANTSTDNGHNPHYERRISLVTTVIQQHSNLGEQEARTLAKHVVHAVDHIPEHIR